MYRVPQWAKFSPTPLRLPWGDQDRRLTQCSLTPKSGYTKWVLDLFCRFCTVKPSWTAWQTDRQTDRQTPRSSVTIVYISCIQCSLKHQTPKSQKCVNIFAPIFSFAFIRKFFTGLLSFTPFAYCLTNWCTTNFKIRYSPVPSVNYCDGLGRCFRLVCIYACAAVFSWCYRIFGE